MSDRLHDARHLVEFGTGLMVLPSIAFLAWAAWALAKRRISARLGRVAIVFGLSVTASTAGVLLSTLDIADITIVTTPAGLIGECIAVLLVFLLKEPA